MSIVTCLIFVNDDRADKMVCAHSRAARDNNLPESSVQLAALRFGGVVNGQVLASLLVSVTLVGIKLNAAKEIVQTIERRKELVVNLSLLQRGLEAEDKKAWIVDVIHDTKHREDRIAELESASGLSYTRIESEVLQKGAAMFAVFESSSGGAKELERSATIMRCETQLDEATHLLLGRATAMIRATPQEIATYLLNFDSRHVQSDQGNFVRSETLEHANAHHTIIFNRGKLGAGLSERTFLNSTVANRVADDPPTYVLVSAPIAHHAKITPKDEVGAVRAENCRAFKLTEVAPGVTKWTTRARSTSVGLFRRL